jgi:manganese oxidase
MEEGMGMIKRHALSEENAPGFGRGMGMTSAEKPTTPMVGPSPHASHGRGGARSADGRVPGFPQDMWMPMDDEVARPETWGLPNNWSAALGGMMTLVRVLPPDRYEEIMALVKEVGPEDASSPAPAVQKAPEGGHHH